MNERGFSLVEVIVAIVILAVGVLGLAASAGAIVRMYAEGGRVSGAAAVAESRFELLRAGTCTTMASGTATTGEFTERWVVSSPTTLLRLVSEQITYSYGRGTRSTTFVTQISCAPSI